MSHLTAGRTNLRNRCEVQRYRLTKRLRTKIIIIVVVVNININNNNNKTIESFPFPNIRLRFETTMIDMLRAPMDKVDSVQKKIHHVSRKMEILRKSDNKSTVTEMKNAFDGLISILYAMEVKL